MSKLEKGISGTDQTSSLLSIAISLKRIADNMERVEITGEPIQHVVDTGSLKSSIKTDILRDIDRRKNRGIL